MPRVYFDDMQVGDRYGGQTYETEREEMLAFAAKWDPRDIHLDDEAGRRAGFEGFIATGSYTIAIFTLLSQRARAEHDHATIAGLGSDMKLPTPVRPGDVLRFEAEIVELRASRSRPDAGIVTTRVRLLNQRDEPAYDALTMTLIARRPEEAA